MADSTADQTNQTPTQPPSAAQTQSSLTQPPSLQLGPHNRIVGLKRGMIFWATVRRAEAQGSEQSHDYPNPWLVVSADIIHGTFPIVQAVPLSSKLAKETGFRSHRIRIPISDISLYAPLAGVKSLDAQDQLALTEQARVLACQRLNHQAPIAHISSSAMASVEAGIRYVFGM